MVDIEKEPDNDSKLVGLSRIDMETSKRELDFEAQLAEARRSQTTRRSYVNNDLITQRTGGSSTASTQTSTESAQPIATPEPEVEPVEPEPIETSEPEVEPEIDTSSYSSEEELSDDELDDLEFESQFEEFDDPDGQSLVYDDEDVDENNDDVLDELLAEESEAEDEAEQQRLIEEERVTRELFESNVDMDIEKVRSHIVKSSYPRNPAPMTDDATRIDEDRPLTKAVSSENVAPGSSPMEPLRMDGSQGTVKLPTKLVETLRAVAIQTLTNTTTRLDATQERQAKGHVGSNAWSQMNDSQRIEAWLDWLNQNMKNNRLVIAFLAAHANLDIEGLDQTTAMLVDAFRLNDPVLRELHVNTRRLDDVVETARSMKEREEHSLQLLRELELAMSYMIAWTTPALSNAQVAPSGIRIVNQASRTVRDRLIAQTKQDLESFRRSSGRPI